VSGVVSGLQTGSGGPQLEVDGKSLPLADITSISTSSVAAAPSNTQTSTGPTSTTPTSTPTTTSATTEA